MRGDWPYVRVPSSNARMNYSGRWRSTLAGISMIVLFCLLLLSSGCGGGSSSGGMSGSGTPGSGSPGSGSPGSGNPGSGGPSGESASVPLFGHVFLVVEENHSYDEVIGNSAMPYFNGLASQYGLAAQYYANAHPSIGNYFMLTTGELETSDDSFAGVVTDDNLVRELVKAGKSWRSYAEGLPSIGYLGGDSSPYLKRHNPFAYFSDVVNDPAQAANLVPFSQFATDLASGSLPDFSFIVPDALDDAHNGTLAGADLWLQQNVQPLIASPLFQNDSLLIITFDESEQSDVLHGGGHVATVIVSAKALPKYQSQTTFQHESSLRLIMEALGLQTDLGQAESAPDMSEFF